jgi:undecaprenyl-diphosphatase
MSKYYVLDDEPGGSRLPLWRRLALPVFTACLLGFFGLLADEVTEGDTQSFDVAVLKLFRDPADPSRTIGPPQFAEAMRDLTSLGSFSVLGIIALLVALALLLRGASRTGWYIAAAVISGAIISTLFKMVFDRPRPNLEGTVQVFTASFPSGHATVSAVVYLTMGALLARTANNFRLKAFYVGAAVFLTVLIGVSRLYLGVHYPTDVLAGWLIGTSWALICWAGAEALERRKAFDGNPPKGDNTDNGGNTSPG